MPKIFNIVASLIAVVLSIALIYMLWSPVTGFINAMTGTFKPIASLIWMGVVIFATVVGPFLLLTQEDLAEKLRR